MSRWSQTWLDGPGGSDEAPGYAGERFGFPADGPRSVARFLPRLGALVLDWLPWVLVANVATANPEFSTLALFAVYTTITVAIFGRTGGHVVLGLRVAATDGTRPGFVPAVIRTVLLCLVIPPLVYNSDGRGLHDRAAGTIVLRTR